MADKIRVGIIGVGQIGKYHLQEYAAIPEAEVVAACDIRQDELKRVAAERNIPHTFTDYHKLLDMDEIQAVDVCLHNSLHAQVTIDALKAGKHVYCEKPIAGTYAQAKQMVQTAKQTGRKLAVQLVTLYEPAARAAKRIMEAGTLGHIYYAKTSNYRRRGRPFVDGYGAREFVNTSTSQGGALLDMLVYHAGRMLWLLGNPGVLTVSGNTFMELDNMYEDRRKSSNCNVEEFGLGLVRLDNGVTLLAEEAWAAHMDHGSGDQIFGSRGGLRLDPFTYFNTLCDMEFSATTDLANADWRWHQCIAGTGDIDNPQRHWIASLQGRCELIDSAGITLKTSIIFDGIYLSKRLGREVTAAEIEKGT